LIGEGGGEGEEVDELGSRLASSLLNGHGELFIPLGAHPSPQYTYNPPTTTTTDTIPTIGKPLTSTQLGVAIERLRKSCEGMKAEVTELYRMEDKDGLVHGCWLIRLVPRGVEEIMEVRVAVVGNVDAGKSTTLGVLTRGGLDDGRGKVSDPIMHNPVFRNSIYSLNLMIALGRMLIRLRLVSRYSAILTRSKPVEPPLSAEKS
jgi:hypothetical protein